MPLTLEKKLRVHIALGSFMRLSVRLFKKSYGF